MHRRNARLASVSAALLAASFVVAPLEGAPPAVTRPAQDLTGRIVSPPGAPLEGATVFVYTAAPRTGASVFCPSCYADCGKRVTTDASGAFRLPSLDPNLVFRLLIVRDGYEPAFVPGADPVKGALPAVTLKPSEPPAAGARGVLRGRVVDGDGRPVVGAIVTPGGAERIADARMVEEYRGYGLKLNEGEKRKTLGTIDGVTPLAISDSRGQFWLRSTPNTAALLLDVKARGLAPRKSGWLEVSPNKTQEVRLAAGATLAGTVKDASGKLLPGVVVRVSQADRSAETFAGPLEIATDDRGMFSLPNVPAGDRLAVVVTMDSLTGRDAAVPVRVVPTGADGTTAPSLTLATVPSATLTGIIRLADGGKMPAGSRVLLDRSEAWDSQETQVGPDGRFTFRGVPRGERLELHPAVKGYRAKGETRLKLEAGAPAPAVEIVVSR